MALWKSPQTGILCVGGWNHHAGGRSNLVLFLPLEPAPAQGRRLTNLVQKATRMQVLQAGEHGILACEAVLMLCKGNFRNNLGFFASSWGKDYLQCVCQKGPEIQRWRGEVWGHTRPEGLCMQDASNSFMVHVQLVEMEPQPCLNLRYISKLLLFFLANNCNKRLRWPRINQKSTVKVSFSILFSSDGRKQSSVGDRDSEDGHILQEVLHLSGPENVCLVYTMYLFCRQSDSKYTVKVRLGEIPQMHISPLLWAPLRGGAQSPL